MVSEKKTTRKKKRSQGRPNQKSKAAVGKAELIEATRRLLKQRSPSELSRLEIARYAGVDPALVRYYFGNMSGLLTEVTANLSRDMHAEIAAGISAARDPKEKLRNRIDAMLKVHAENPHLHELIVRQIVHGTRSAAKTARHKMVSDSVATLRALLEEGIDAGLLRPVDPRMLHVTIIGMCDFFFTGRPVLDELFGREAVPGLVKEYGQFVFDLIFEGLSRRSGEAAAPSRRKAR